MLGVHLPKGASWAPRRCWGCTCPRAHSQTGADDGRPGGVRVHRNSASRWSHSTSSAAAGV